MDSKYTCARGGGADNDITGPQTMGTMHFKTHMGLTLFSFLFLSNPCHLLISLGSSPPPCPHPNPTMGGGQTL